MEELNDIEQEKQEELDEIEKRDLSFLLDVKLRINVSVGKTEKLFKDVLKLKEGDLISLDKNIEEYLDVYLNGKQFAVGEMIIVNDKYSVRIIDLA